MVSIQKVIKDAGMNPIQCPSCGKSIHTNTLWPGFFRRIIEIVAKGETVTVSSFGNFRARVLKGRTLKSPLLSGGKVKFGDRLVMRFHASASAKKILNGQEVDEAEGIDNDEAEAAEEAAPAKKATKKKVSKKASKPAVKKPAAKKGKPAPQPESDEDDEDVEDHNSDDEGEDFDDEDEDNDEE